jgi:integrase
LEENKMKVRVGLRGLASATKILANGCKRTYYYPWRGGPCLRGEDGALLDDPQNERFRAAFDAAHRSRKEPKIGTLFNLIALYRGSSEFTTLADKTRKSYGYFLKLIENEYGNMPLDVVQHPKARGEFKAFRDRLASKPRTADLLWVVLARVLSVGKDRGMIAVNVCERGGRLYRADRTEKIWRTQDIKAFCAVANPELQFALVAALWLGQRQSDLLRLAWTNYDGTHVKLRQGKGKKRVTIPVGAPLKAALDAAKLARPDATTILTNTRGASWTEDGFRTSWGKAFRKAKLAEDLHFHDLRGTAVTRLALAGCTVPQIAAITGHSLKDVESILSAHYLGGTLELAEAAITKLNAAYG